MKRSSAWLPTLSRAVWLLIFTLRKLVLSDFARFPLRALLMLWSKLRSIISGRWPSPRKGSPGKPSGGRHHPDSGQSQVTKNNKTTPSIRTPVNSHGSSPRVGIPSIACSSYPPRFPVSSMPQYLNVPQPVVYEDRLCSHASLPDLTTAEQRPQIQQFDLPVRAEFFDGDAFSKKLGANLSDSHPEILPFVPGNLQRYDRNAKVYVPRYRSLRIVRSLTGNMLCTVRRNM